MTEKPHTAQLGKILVASRRARAHLPPALPPLLALTDPTRSPDPVLLAAALPKGSGLVYRHFGASERFETANKVMRLARARRLVVLIGNDPDLAIAVGADGVHWAEAHLARARRWRSCFRVMTAATHSRAALARAQAVGINAALLSTVFASKSESAGKAMGPIRFRQLVRQAGLPVYALGGLASTNMGRISQFGAIAAIDGLAPFLG